MQAFEQLEYEYGQWLGNPHCVAVASGTAALHLACEVLRRAGDLHRTDLIAMPDYTMVACPRAAAMANITPTFLDCDDSLLMVVPPLLDVNAIMAVHVYGRPCDMEKVHKVGVPVIEDLAEAHGLRPHPNTFAACWSFYKNKIVFGEEGGMIAFKEERHARHARQLRSLGFDDNHDYNHIPRGVNARMSNAHANLILPTFHKMTNNLLTRHYLSAVYSELLPKEWHAPTLTQYPWVYDIRIPGMSYEQQTAIVSTMNAANIAARHGFKPMSSQREFAWTRLARQNKNAYRLAPQVMYLPLSETMNADDIRRICSTLKEIVKNVMRDVDL